MNICGVSSSFLTLFSSPETPTQAKRVDFSEHSYTDVDEQWFDAQDFFEEPVSFTEDCLRSIKQLIFHYATVKQNEFILNVLVDSHRYIPVEFANVVYSYYQALVHKENIDIALFNTLGFAASRQFIESNGISELAQKIRDMIADYIGGDYLQQFLGNSENEFFNNFFIILAVAAVVSRFWITDRSAPRRALLKIPTFLASIIIRLGGYWRQSGLMARQAEGTCQVSVANKSMEHFHCTRNNDYYPHAGKTQGSRDGLWTCIKMSGRATDTKACAFTFASEALAHVNKNGQPFSVRYK